MENNSLGDIAIAAQSGKTLAELAKEHVDQENEHYRIQNCADISADACSAKMYQERQQFLKDLVLFGLDMTPIVGDIKGLLDAQTALEYLMATPFVGKLDKFGKIGLYRECTKKGDFDEANRLIQNAKKEQAVAGKPTTTVQTGGKPNTVKPTESSKGNYTLSKDGKLLGRNGVQVPSKTLWNDNGKERIDVENPDYASNSLNNV